MKSYAGEPVYVGRTPLFINPGTGPVHGGTEINAMSNITQLIRDAGFDPAQVEVFRDEASDERGRLGFSLQCDGNACLIDMPGLELEEVRFVDLGTQNIWNFPRLYIDGGSWVWRYAVGIVRETLLGECEE